MLFELRRTNSRRVGMVEALRDRSFRRNVLVGFLIFVSLTCAFYAMAFAVSQSAGLHDFSYVPPVAAHELNEVHYKRRRPLQERLHPAFAP